MNDSELKRNDLIFIKYLLENIIRYFVACRKSHRGSCGGWTRVSAQHNQVIETMRCFCGLGNCRLARIVVVLDEIPKSNRRKAALS